MKRTMGVRWGGLLCASLLALHGSVQAKMMAPDPIQRAATADVIVVGKVTGFADKTVSAERFPGDKEKGQYQIAIIKVETNIHGAKGHKEIKVGFIPPMPAPVGGAIRPPIRRPRTPTLALDQEGLMFLTKHHNADFYIAPMYFSIVNKQGNDNFNKEVDEVKRCMKLLADPKAGLDARESSDRLLTAGMLMAKYRAYKQGAGQPKMKPIDPEISKKILLAIANADWNARPVRPSPLRITPMRVFDQLQLTDKDGWTPPKDFKELPFRVREWCKANADKYVIKRFVFEDDKSEKKGDR